MLHETQVTQCLAQCVPVIDVGPWAVATWVHPRPGFGLSSMFLGYLIHPLWVYGAISLPVFLVWLLPYRAPSSH